MNSFKKIFSALCVIFFILTGIAYGDKVCSDGDNRLNWQSLLEQSFLKTFSSSQEFARSQVFQCLGYDLAEVSQIKKVTPFPKSVSVTFEGMKETETFIASETRRIVAFEKLAIRCKKVQYFGMTMEELVFTFPDCSLEKDYLIKEKIRFARVSHIDLKVKVSEENLLSVMKLYSKSSALSSVKIYLYKDKVKCSGKVKMGFIVADFVLKGYTRLASPKKVTLICEKLYLNRIAQPRAFIRPIMDYVNPVFDSTKVWINLNILKMDLKNGFVETAGIIGAKEKNNAN